MKELDNPFIEESSHERTAKLRRNIGAYLRRWPILLLSILFFLFLAWLYTRYLTPQYESFIKILVKDSQKNAGANILLNDVAVAGNINGGIDNEIQIMQSRRLLDQVVQNLQLSNQYLREGKVIESEAYGRDLPLLLKSLTPDSANLYQPLKVSYNHPNIQVNYGDKQINTKVNKSFKLESQILFFYQNPQGNFKKTDDFIVHLTNKESVSRSLQNKLNIEMVNNYSSVLLIKMVSGHFKKSEDILTELVRVYNVDAIKDKTLEFEKTAEFIEERIAILDEELSGVETEKEQFQKSNDIADLPTEIGISINSKEGLERDLLNAETELSLVDTYRNHVQNQSITEILPSDISNSSGGTNNAVVAYNQYVIERNDLIANGATDKHPRVQNLVANIESAKSNILANITKQRQVLNENKSNILQKLGSATSFKSNSPTLSKIYRDIDRQQQIKESLYLLLLEKREEAAISKAITDDKIKIINPATSVGPISPIKSRYYFGAFAIGLLLPLAFIYTRELLKNKIETRGDLEELVKGQPIIAEIPKVNTDEKFKLVGSDLSAISEAFRIMRTNIEFVISRRLSSENRGKVILVTSSIKGEGKTFVSMNYAHVLGQLKNKKAIIIGADIRNPQLHRYHSVDKKITGLTEYLYDENATLEDIINVSKADNLTHIIYSGRIPPNPTELLMSDRFDALILELKQKYDYVIIDSAPLVLVSDTYHISNNADLTVYVTRSDFTPKDVIKVPIDAVEEGRLKNVVFALNDISSSHSGYAYGYKYNYGYGYGYGTVDRRRSPLKRFLSNLGINVK